MSIKKFKTKMVMGKLVYVLHFPQFYLKDFYLSKKTIHPREKMLKLMSLGEEKSRISFDLYGRAFFKGFGQDVLRIIHYHYDYELSDSFK